ncbi:mitochondrial import inner membrane translocase subunit Tim8 A [Ceratina calcarata]|uniref:Mitochondrial import inner membrane translocase subunit n=1 Tax=Ceratina calcarata TaxID=156304 RepID=A0AAJ7ITV0_9HYME|nr:mitochondrial import inner membrane translocase subunit Tim8 A [Ceratina calcarata]XP_017876755.1 mitochondrial import inner membrane translocase subunit Tim8 A [Ceratina calcarata]XP_017876756.1 mitochondrial import inner membrane translocase subunit Tim8 A [Ceratina calcarata]
MKFMEEQRSKVVVDDQFQAFILRESKHQEFQRFALDLTDICWELCMGTPGRALDSGTKLCLANCVDRFIDTSNFISYRLRNIVLSSPKEIDVQ